MDLFEQALEKDEAAKPLAERMRPRRLEDFVGQEHVLGPGSALRRAIEADQVPSLILWGPPGTGKTTLARIVAERTGAVFVPFSAVLGGVKEIREIVEAARARRKLHRQRTILFVDEIHRFSRNQQDAFLPHVEAGTLTLIGATTENPSFEINAALLSRCRVVTLRPLTDEEVGTLLDRAVASPQGLGGRVRLAEDAREALARSAFGDARRALVALEASAAAAQLAGRAEIAFADAEEALQHKALNYDKAGEEHFNVVSAFIKSLRGSDPDAAVYYMVRMLEGGEEPRFILRRMVIFASEDVGNADPQALQVAVSALHAVELVGLPEGVLPMSQAAIYLSLAPKSNTAITAYAAARKLVQEFGPLPVPLKLRNAPTRLMESLGYGGGYRYPHNFEGHYVAEEYLPDAVRGSAIVKLSDSGRERELAERLARLRASLEPGDK
ncbi:MAG TPA: replication-associated recombination protein A [Anaeromyxobacteraceae bacterium]|nr:replication-associated recombination protein A [Anaeromyxobacteraceae bacterium]